MGDYIDNASREGLQRLKCSLGDPMDGGGLIAGTHVAIDQKLKEQDKKSTLIWDARNQKQLQISPYGKVDPNVKYIFNDPSVKPSPIYWEDSLETRFGIDILYKKRDDGKLKPKQKKAEGPGVSMGFPNPNNYDPDDEEWKKQQKDAKKFNLDSKNANDKKILDNLDNSAQEFIAKNGKGSVLREFPGEYLDKTLREIFKADKAGIQGARTARKLLTGIRFLK